MGHKDIILCIVATTYGTVGTYSTCGRFNRGVMVVIGSKDAVEFSMISKMGHTLVISSLYRVPWS